MREGIGTVGCDVYLDEPVALQVVVFCCGGTDNGILRQHDDASMVVANAYLVLGTNHAQRLYAAQLRLLDDKLLVAIVEHTAQVGHDNLLACCHVGSTTDNLLGLALA